MMSFVIQVMGATIGSIAFSLLYGVPKQYYPWCGITGGVGWFVYLLVKMIAGSFFGALASAVVIVLLSRIFAVRKHCPVTIFLIAGIFPLVPGAGICMTSYHMVVNDLREALTTGMSAMKVAIAIVLGIVLVFGLPQSFFRKVGTIGMKKERRCKEFGISCNSCEKECRKKK